MRRVVGGIIGSVVVLCGVLLALTCHITGYKICPYVSTYGEVV